jgi:transposase-like protein
MTIVNGELKENVLKHLKQNKSLNQISKEFNLNKTTIFYWYKKLGKSKTTKVSIKQMVIVN